MLIKLIIKQYIQKIYKIHNDIMQQWSNNAVNCSVTPHLSSIMATLKLENGFSTNRHGVQYQYKNSVVASKCNFNLDLNSNGTSKTCWRNRTLIKICYGDKHGYTKYQLKTHIRKNYVFAMQPKLTSAPEYQTTLQRKVW